MATLADLRDAVSNWFTRINSGDGIDLLQKPIDAQPNAFYQARNTRTPGIVSNELPPGVAAQYNPVQSGYTKVNESNLDRAIKALLLKEFGDKPPGFITSRTDATSKAMRHEQLHDLYERGGVNEISNGLAPLVDTGIANYLRQSKIYQKEAANEGWPRIIADEGSAMDLTGNNPSESIKGLIADFLSRKGRTTELKQFKELVK